MTFERERWTGRREIDEPLRPGDVAMVGRLIEEDGPGVWVGLQIAENPVALEPTEARQLAASLLDMADHIEDNG
jgi:hypothetical protein